MISTGSAIFICPQCANRALTIHRKTYENNVIIFCTKCNLRTAFTPSKDASYDEQLTYKEFRAKYEEKLQTV